MSIKILEFEDVNFSVIEFRLMRHAHDVPNLNTNEKQVIVSLKIFF